MDVLIWTEGTCDQGENERTSAGELAWKAARTAALHHPPWHPTHRPPTRFQVSAGPLSAPDRPSRGLADAIDATSSIHHDPFDLVPRSLPFGPARAHPVFAAAVIAYSDLSERCARRSRACDPCLARFPVRISVRVHKRPRAGGRLEPRGARVVQARVQARAVVPQLPRQGGSDGIKGNHSCDGSRGTLIAYACSGGGEGRRWSTGQLSS